MTQRKYYLTSSIQKLSDGLFGMKHIRWGRQLWCLCKMRKDHRCVITNTIIKKGQQAYRPITTSAGNRYERIHPQFFEANQ